MKINQKNMEKVLNELHKSINVDYKLTSKSDKIYKVGIIEDNLFVEKQFDIKIKIDASLRKKNFDTWTNNVIQPVGNVFIEKLNKYIQDKEYITFLTNNKLFIEKDGLILNMIYNNDMFKISLLIGYKK